MTVALSIPCMGAILRGGIRFTPPGAPWFSRSQDLPARRRALGPPASSLVAHSGNGGARPWLAGPMSCMLNQERLEFYLWRGSW